MVRNQLIEGNLHLVAHICKKFESSGVDRKDMVSKGTIGLIKGVSTISRENGARLAIYVAHCIENEILMYLRAIKNQKSETSLYDPMGTDKEGNEIALLDILGSDLPSAQEKVETEEDGILLRRLIAELSRQEHFVVEGRFGLGKDQKRLIQKEIAGKLGILRSYVSGIEKRALEKLKRSMGKTME